MDNLDKPAVAEIMSYQDGSVTVSEYVGGFTKRERTCIDLLIPDTGDEELDELIRRGRRQHFAALALGAGEPVVIAVPHADEVIAILEKG